MKNKTAAEIAYDATRLSPVLVDIADDGAEADAAEQFAAGYMDGLAIGRALLGGAEVERLIAAELRRLVDAAPDQATKSRIILRAADQILADPVVVTRHTVNSDGSIPHDPWTTYDLGDASIDIQDAGGVSVYVGGDGLEQMDKIQLRDLAALLADPHVRAALGW